MLIALTRPVPASLPRCELTHLARTPIDLAGARAEHDGYARALASLGCDVWPIAAADDLPDSVFVEDTAVVLDEVAILTRPGAPSRRPETVAVAAALEGLRSLARIAAPGTLDGGDVLCLDRTLYVGLGSRSNRAGADQLAAVVRPHGYEVRTVCITRCLHLKSAVSSLATGLILVNPRWVDPHEFEPAEAISVSPDEPAAANVLLVGAAILCAEAHAGTARRIEAAGLAVRAIRMQELAKAEAGVTCCSLMLRNGS